MHFETNWSRICPLPTTTLNYVMFLGKLNYVVILGMEKTTALLVYKRLGKDKLVSHNVVGKHETMASTKAIENNGQQLKNIKKTMSFAAQVQKNVNTILAQSDITLKAIPNLPKHQQTARDHAKAWDDVWKGVLFTTSEFISYAHSFNESYSAMMEDVKTIKDPNSTPQAKEAARDDIESILSGVVLPKLKEKKLNATNQTAKIKKFHDSFQTAYSEFQADFATADKIITQDNQDLIKKKAKLAKAKAVAEGLEIGLGVDGGLLPITAAYTFAAGPIGVIVGGILLAIEIGALVGLLIEYANAMEKVNTIQSEITAEKQEVTQLTGVETQIKGLQNATVNIQQASQQIESCWETLEGDMKEVIQNVGDVSPDKAASVVEIQLKAVNDTWQTILADVEKLRPVDGKIPSKTYANAAEFLKAVRPKQGS